MPKRKEPPRLGVPRLQREDPLEGGARVLAPEERAHLAEVQPTLDEFGIHLDESLERRAGIVV